MRPLTRNALGGVPARQGWLRIYPRMPLPDDALTGSLSAAEQARFREWRSPRRARDWLEGRVALKHALLTEHVVAAGTSWEAIDILPDDAVGPTGEPRVWVDATRLPLRFSISHWPDGVAVAMSTGPVGIDGEHRFDQSCDAATWFTGEEHRVSRCTPAARCPDVDCNDALVGLWTLKEACWKAMPEHRLGLTVTGLDASRLAIASLAGASRVSWVGGTTNNLDRWSCVWNDPDKQ